MTASGATTATPATGRRRWRPRPNPVLRRELVERWRGRRAFVVATAYLAVLTGMMLLLLWAASSWLAAGNGRGLDAGPTLGRFLLENVFGLVLLLVLFVGPGYAAAQISQERERRTLGLLQITLVSPWRIVTGKLGAASAWLLLLVVLAAPMATAAFFLGGVAIGDVLRGVTYVAVVTVAIAAMGIGISSLVRRTVAAVVLTYGLVLALVGGTVFGAVIEVAFSDGERPTTILANPFVGLADAVRVSELNELPSILTPFGLALPPENRGEQTVFGGGGIPVAVPDGARLEPAPFEVPAFDQPPERAPVWVGVMAGHAAAGALALWLASRRVRPGREPRVRSRGGRDRAPRELVATPIPAAPGPPTTPPTDVPPPPPPAPPEQP